MKGNAVSLIALFSSNILSTCLVRGTSSSASMDRYFKQAQQKSEYEFTKMGPAVCVLGKSGIGKTWAVHKALDPCIELTPDVLKGKQDTINFLDKIRGTNIAVILDEFEHVQDMAGVREITGPPTNGLFVVISQIPVKFDFEINTYEFPVPGPDDIRLIAPGVSDEVLAKCRGDLRYAIRSLTMKGDDPDDFMGAREFVTDLVALKSNTNPLDFIGHGIQEPGNIASILHENYTDSKLCDHVRVIEDLSEAMIFENKIYEGQWDLYPYYNLLACVSPAIAIGHTLKPPLRPGSFWTKGQSAAARSKKISAMASRVDGKRLNMDELLLLRSYAEKGNVEILKDYKLIPQDIDVMNHLSPLRKIKAKDVQVIKKNLQA